MNLIKRKIINEIDTTNGISLDKFIDICLFSKDGYYKKAKPIGKKGDFTTAPEISQLFGEILGLYIYNFWQKKINTKFNLIELGPGKGTLISDILRITQSFDKFHNLMNIHLIEINKKLIKLQKKNIQKIYFNLKKIVWHDSFKAISSEPSIIFANEFFDCFPTKQFIKINYSWNEKKINFNKKEKKFFIYNTDVNDNSLILKLENYATKYNYKEGQIIEMSPQREIYFDKICKFIKKNSGILIIFDYGYNSSIHHSTLQSVNNHNYTHILDNPGQQDITSFVNFANFKETCIKNNMNYFKFFSQKDFLIKNGIVERKNQIIVNSTNKQKKDIEQGLQRLISNDQMGLLYKCLILSNSNILNE